MHEWRVSRAALQCLSRDLPTHRLLWTVKGPSFPKYGYFNRKSHTAGAIESLIFQARQLIADAPGGIINDWQDKRILYARAEISLLFGKILLKCTLGQAFWRNWLILYAFYWKKLSEGTFREYLARKQPSGCAGVQNTRFLPHIGRRIHSRLFNESQRSLSADNLICIRPLNRNGT